MTTTILLLSALAVVPVERFALDHPSSARVTTHDGVRLLHASGFQADLGARGPVEAARAFLATQGAVFGEAPDQTLVLRGAPAAGRAGAVRFERRVGGLPVFGGDLVVGVDAQNRVHAVNTGDVPSTTSGAHAIGEAGAAAAALAAFPGGARGAGPAVVAVGWRNLLGTLRAVYRVDFVATEPAGDWRIFVDGQTSAPLFREDIRFRATAPASVYEVSPVETLGSRCGTRGCATPITVTLPNLTAAPPTTLAGSQTTVYNCKGANAPTTVPGACSTVASVSGGFSFAADTTWLSPTDDFAAVMAYYHLDKLVSFFKALDPTLPGGTLRAINGSLPGVVNVRVNGVGFDNAFYSGGIDGMVFGQGTVVDLAYDATIAYHEMTHGVVQAWGGFNIDIDALGGLDEPGAANEGTADAMAVSEVGRSTVGSFFVLPFLRDMSDPSASRSCQGDGSPVTQFGVSGVINGLNGEVHDDGEIWNGFYWEVYQGLMNAGIRGCSGACEAGPALQYHALQLAAGTGPTLGSYWQTFKSAASALFPANANVASYVDCVARRRGMDKCDRTVPVYAGEDKLAFTRLRWSPFQLVVRTTGNATINVCSASGAASILHARVGQPVALSAINPSTGAATVAETGAVPFTQACSTGFSPISLNSAGATTWYLLFEGPSAVIPNNDIFWTSVGTTNVVGRPGGTTPPTCTIAASGPVISPAAPTVPARASTTFTATGGTGAYTWTLQTNASGGSINASTGAYTAGTTGGVTDVVRVTDAAMATSTANVTVTAVSLAPQTASLAVGATQTFTASGGVGPYTWSLQTNASGGSIGATTGLYTAGPTSGGTDVVRALDSLGNVGTATVSVTAAGGGGGGGGGSGTSSSKKGCGCTTGGEGGFTLGLAAVALLGWRPARRRRVAR